MKDYLYTMLLLVVFSILFLDLFNSLVQFFTSIFR